MYILSVGNNVHFVYMSEKMYVLIPYRKFVHRKFVHRKFVHRKYCHRKKVAVPLKRPKGKKNKMGELKVFAVVKKHILV